jgi:hypothetical protein
MMPVGTAATKAREEAEARRFLRKSARPRGRAPPLGARGPPVRQKFDVVSLLEPVEGGRLNLNSRQFMGERLS